MREAPKIRSDCELHSRRKPQKKYRKFGKVTFETYMRTLCVIVGVDVDVFAFMFSS